VSSRFDNVVQPLDTFVVNLAVGDLLVCVVTMTTEILFVAFSGQWVLGPVTGVIGPLCQWVLGPLLGVMC